VKSREETRGQLVSTTGRRYKENTGTTTNKKQQQENKRESKIQNTKYQNTKILKVQKQNTKDEHFIHLKGICHIF